MDRGNGLYAVRCEVYGSPAHPGPRVAGSGGFGEYPAPLTATRTRHPGLEATPLLIRRTNRSPAPVQAMHTTYIEARWLWGPAAISASYTPARPLAARHGPSSREPAGIFSVGQGL
jgi:hypothetical protein